MGPPALHYRINVAAVSGREWLGPHTFRLTRAVHTRPEQRPEPLPISLKPPST